MAVEACRSMGWIGLPSSAFRSFGSIGGATSSRWRATPMAASWASRISEAYTINTSGFDLRWGRLSRSRIVTIWPSHIALQVSSRSHWCSKNGSAGCDP